MASGKALDETKIRLWAATPAGYEYAYEHSGRRRRST
jgi:hypothetical protein